MANGSGTGQHGGHLAPLFVVEVASDGQRPQYVICERFFVVGPDQTVDGITVEMLNDLISNTTLRAAALPTADDCGGDRRWIALAQTAQSGHRPGLNITINNFPDRD